MRLTAFTDYSLRVLIYLATRPGERATIAQIATAFQVSEHHLVKVVHFLGKCGWLANVRGKGGGLQLARAPDAINLAEVVRDTEGDTPVVQCFDRDDRAGCVIAPSCRLRSVLAEAQAAFQGVLARYSLADLVDNREELATLLFMPLPARPGTPQRRA